jgi:hypothetical protein
VILRRMWWRPLFLAAALVVASGCGLAQGPEMQVPGFARIDGPWSATPIQVPAATLAAADQACRKSFQQFPAGVQIVVIDARGKA